MKNETDLIHNSEKRILSAKGYKFQNQLIEIYCNSIGLTRYHKEVKEIKEKIKALTLDLIIDKRFSIAEIKEIIKNSKFLQLNN